MENFILNMIEQYKKELNECSYMSLRDVLISRIEFMELLIKLYQGENK